MKFALTQIKSPQTHHNHHNSLSEVIETICHGLSELQYENIVTDDLSLSDYQYIVFAPYRNPTQPILPPNSIIYNFDQIYPNSPMVQAGYLDYLFQYPVWDYSLVNISQLKQWGINKVQYLPVGYVPQLTRIDLSAHKDLEILSTN